MTCGFASGNCRLLRILPKPLTLRALFVSEPVGGPPIRCNLWRRLRLAPTRTSGLAGADAMLDVRRRGGGQVFARKHPQAAAYAPDEVGAIGHRASDTRWVTLASNCNRRFDRAPLLISAAPRFGPVQ